jgi:hypothetical protein
MVELEKQQSEEDLLADYRYGELLRRGVQMEFAEMLADRKDIVHDLDYLLEKGCPIELAVRIIL